MNSASKNYSNGRPKLFKLDFRFPDPIRQSFLELAKAPLEYMLSLDQLNRVYYDSLDSYEKNADLQDTQKSFIECVISTLNVNYKVLESDLKRIPQKGPVILVANHPFGGIEGLILGQLMSQRRDDVKIMANFLLERIPELRPYFIFVDPFGSETSARANIRGMRNAISHVEQGGALGIFPAGEVAHFDFVKGQVREPDWSPTIGRIIRKTGAAVVPVYFDGFNGPLFQLMGLIHPRLRTMMLPWELVNKKDSTIRIQIGNPISTRKLEQFNDDQERIDYLRSRTLMLQNREWKQEEKTRSLFYAKGKKQEFEPIVEPVSRQVLLDDLEHIGDTLLLESGKNSVYCAPAARIPNILHEIGRLREITFRDTNEGTGKSIDLDWYDEHYHHLFVWNNEDQDLVGAYRLGKSDELLQEFGKKGLYTSTLFQYRSALLREISPALEMGRSFIQKKYQRSFSSLLLLWKGIGHFAAANPRYKILFGPVSINNEYQSLSRQLIISFLKMNRFSKPLSRLVRAKTPFRPRAIKGVDQNYQSRMVASLEEVNDLIADLETTQKGVPILLKQYLNLGGVLLGFNVDPDFSDVLDGLILVDLTKTGEKLLKRYMGDEGTEAFLEYHGLLETA